MGFFQFGSLFIFVGQKLTKMTKADIVKQLAQETGVEAVTVLAVVEGFMEEVRAFRGPAVFLFGRKRRRFVPQPPKNDSRPRAQNRMRSQAAILPPPPKSRFLSGRAQNRMTSVPKPPSVPKTRLLAGLVIFYSE